MQAEMLDSIVSKSLQLFADKGFKVRVIMRCSDPWFVAKDVATCIEHKDVSTMCRVCRDRDIAVINGKEYSADLAEYSESRGNPNLTVVSESGLYRILAKCNLPKCEPFENWVFDEVLPSIRKTGSYGMSQISRKDQLFLAIIHSESEEERAGALKELEEINKQEVKALTAERDEAIRTKAQISSNREATAMATASAKARECEKLREQIGDSKTYKAATAISWLPDYFDMSNRGLYNALAHKLKKLEAEMPPAFAHIDIQDSRWGSVKAYHVAVIERLHEMVQADEALMKKYRKIASV